MSCLVLSCFLSCFVLSCLVLSCLVLLGLIRDCEKAHLRCVTGDVFTSDFVAGLQKGKALIEHELKQLKARDNVDGLIMAAIMTASIQIFERERQDKLPKPRPAMPKPKPIMVKELQHGLRPKLHQTMFFPS